MRIISVVVLLFAFLTFGEAIKFADLLRVTTASATTVIEIPVSTPNSYAVGISQILKGSNMEMLDLRQAPPNPRAAPVPAAPGPPTAPTPTVTALANLPANLPAIPPGVAPAAPLAVPPAAVPLIPPTNGPAVTLPAGAGDSITVQWLETWIGGTSRTWLPHTITLHNQALSETAPLPGKGEIGMGTITGRLGVTQTVIEGAAKTVGPEWKVGAMAAVGVGLAGIV